MQNNRLQSSSQSTTLSEDDFENITYQMIPPSIGGFSKDLLLKVAELSCLAYTVSEVQESCQGHLAEGYSVVPFFDKTPSHAGNVYFKGKEVIVSFRGTWNGSDVLSDLNSLLEIAPFLNNKGRVHSGFYHKFCESCYSIREHILLYCKDRNIEFKDLDFIISGHSMGGAIASIFALWFTQANPQSNIRVATFGSPRTFDFPGAEFYESILGDRTIRVVQHHIDPAATVTIGSLGFKHVGDQLRVGLAEGFYPHQILGYIKYIEKIPEAAFIAKNSASVFWPVSYSLGWLNSAVLGNIQQLCANLFWQRPEPASSWEKKHL